MPGTNSPIQSRLIEQKTINGVVARSPEAIQETFKYLREKYCNGFEVLTDNYFKAADVYHEKEDKVSSSIANLHDRREDLLPNAIYIVAGGLAGSIIARRKNIVVRGLLPVVMGLASFKLFLPETFRNTVNFANQLERENLPQVAETQSKMVSKAEEAYQQTHLSVENSSKKAASLLERCKSYIVEYTGLNLNQTVAERKK